jgi:hypothetical protein
MRFRPLTNGAVCGVACTRGNKIATLTAQATPGGIDRLTIIGNAQ